MGVEKAYRRGMVTVLWREGRAAGASTLRSLSPAIPLEHTQVCTGAAVAAHRLISRLTKASLR